MPDDKPYMTRNEKEEYYGHTQAEYDEDTREEEEEYYEKHWPDIQIREALERRDYRW